MAIIVDCGNQPGFIAANVKNCHLTYLVSAGKSFAQLGKIIKVVPFHYPVPVFKPAMSRWVLFGKFK
jgi:hypothetical protein